MKPIPKSLHTVTVIVKLARYHHNAERGTYDRSIAWAVKFLGYADTPDTHGLAAAALKQLAPKARGTVTGKLGPFGTRTGRWPNPLPVMQPSRLHRFNAAERLPVIHAVDYSKVEARILADLRRKSDSD